MFAVKVGPPPLCGKHRKDRVGCPGCSLRLIGFACAPVQKGGKGGKGEEGGRVKGGRVKRGKGGKGVGSGKGEAANQRSW